MASILDKAFKGEHDGEGQRATGVAVRGRGGIATKSDVDGVRLDGAFKGEL